MTFIESRFSFFKDTLPNNNWHISRNLKQSSCLDLILESFLSGKRSQDTAESLQSTDT